MTPVRTPPTLVGPAEIEAEAQRLFGRIKQPERWDLAMCRVIAPITLEINRLKREKNAVILAHSYQTPDIVYGVADHVGDSYGLSIKARDSTADTIVFSSVRFMAETAKIVNPHKRVRDTLRPHLTRETAPTSGGGRPARLYRNPIGGAR